MRGFQRPTVGFCGFLKNELTVRVFMVSIWRIGRNRWCRCCPPVHHYFQFQLLVFLFQKKKVHAALLRIIIEAVLQCFFTSFLKAAGSFRQMWVKLPKLWKASSEKLATRDNHRQLGGKLTMIWGKLDYVATIYICT